MSTPRRGEPCLCGCGKPAIAKGYAWAEYCRWRRAGFPVSGPPPSSGARTPEAAEERQADFFWSRSLGLTREQAAQDVGVSVKTARKYEESAEEFTDYWYRMEKGGYGDD